MEWLQLGTSAHNINVSLVYSLVTPTALNCSASVKSIKSLLYSKKDILKPNMLPLISSGSFLVYFVVTKTCGVTRACVRRPVGILMMALLRLGIWKCTIVWFFCYIYQKNRDISMFFVLIAFYMKLWIQWYNMIVLVLKTSFTILASSGVIPSYVSPNVACNLHSHLLMPLTKTG